MLREHGIPARSKSSARRLALRRGRVRVKRDDGTELLLGDGSIRSGFLDVLTPESAYVLGVIYPDGCLIETPETLEITQKEAELLEKCRSLMGSNACIHLASNNGIPNSIHKLRIGVAAEWGRLQQLGVHPRKSLTVEFPAFLSSDLLRHFVRGCWDGDGSIYHAHRPFSAATASIVSGSPAFADGLRACLSAESIPPNQSETRPSVNGILTTLKWHGRSIVPLSHYLYDGVHANQYLQRKRDRFARVVHWYEKIAPTGRW